MEPAQIRDYQEFPEHALIFLTSANLDDEVAQYLKGEPKIVPARDGCSKERYTFTPNMNGEGYERWVPNRSPDVPSVRERFSASLKGRSVTPANLRASDVANDPQYADALRTLDDLKPGIVIDWDTTNAGGYNTQFMVLGRIVPGDGIYGVIMSTTSKYHKQGSALDTCDRELLSHKDRRNITIYTAEESARLVNKLPQ